MDWKNFVAGNGNVPLPNSFNHSFTVHRGVCLSGWKE